MKSLFIAIFIAVLSTPIISYGSTYVACGEDENGTCWPCGETCSARLTYPNEEDKANQTNAILTFSGTGAMYNYASPTNNPALTGVEPWYGVARKIVKAVVEDGITTVGSRSIYSMSLLEEVVLPDTIESIGAYAFHGATSLSIIDIPENVKKIYDYAFQNSYNLTALSLPESLFQQGGDVKNNILPDSGITSLYCPKAYEQKCRKILKGSGFKDTAIENILKFYTKSGNEYFYDGKFYQSASDITINNNIKKRIYTLEEANRVAKPTGNTVRIKYR